MNALKGKSRVLAKNLVDIHIKIAEYERQMIKMHFQLKELEGMWVNNRGREVFPDKNGNLPKSAKRLPGAIERAQELRDTLLGFEQGEAMVKLQLGSWGTLKNVAGSLRTEVFVEEQGVSQALEWDEDDARSVHAVLRNRMGLPVATGRLLPAVEGVSKIGRMAVKRKLRGLKLGDHVLTGLLNAARQRGDREVVLHAQCTAENFYQRQGFIRRGDVFQEAGMDHVEMAITL
jgi:predicted GNAT family N-acyltransferase